MELSLWYRTLQRLRDLIPQPQFSQWISPLQVQEKPEELVIFAPNKYVLDGVKQDYLPLIEQAVSEVDEEKGTKLSFVIGAKGLKAKEENVSPTETKNKEPVLITKKNKNSYNDLKNRQLELREYDSISGKPTIELEIPNNLEPSFTFASFVEGKSNQLAKAAALQVGENPAKAYNPLFLYGGVGLGKTHLMHAIGNMIVERKKGFGRVLYLHSERFVANMVRALQDNAINDFKRFYRKLDALLIDDIQFFAGKDRSQEEFFHTFNALLEGQQQIILTSDRYPREIMGIEERLKSRFGSGLTVAVEPPELETRVAILINKALQSNINLQHEIAFFIAKKIRSNVRELEGALKRVIAHSRFTGNPITIDFAQEALKDLFAVQERLVSVDNIIKTVAEYYKIKVVDIMSKSRNRIFSRPRQVAMYLCKELTEKSLPEIGAAFGKKDHTTVLHACKQISKMKETSVEMHEDVQNLLKVLST